MTLQEFSKMNNVHKEEHYESVKDKNWNDLRRWESKLIQFINRDDLLCEIAFSRGDSGESPEVAKSIKSFIKYYYENKRRI